MPLLNPTVDSIVKDLAKIRDRLLSHAGDRFEAAVQHRADATESNKRAAEGNRAAKIAENLSKLLGS